MPPRGPDDTDLAIAATAASDSQQTVGTLAPPAATPVIPRGTAIGKYVVLDVLGSGAMGIVVSAIDPTLDRRVAIKLVKADRGGTTTGQQRLLREAQAMARLAHPNVVTVFEAGTFGERVFLAMEYIAGTTLAGWLASERSPREIIDAFVAAGRGLAAAHRAGIVHRDFKPANVLVARDGRVCVADFGLATAPEARADSVPPPAEVGDLNMTATGAILGTPTYMAPEQHRGVVATAQADQYAFCVALWEALRGELPFEGTGYVEYADNVLGGRVRDTGRPLPARVKRVLLRGMAVEPGARHPDMDVVLDELGHDPTRRLKLAAVAVGIVALGAAGAGIALHHASADPCNALASDDVWTAPAQLALRAAFTGPQGEAALARITPLLAARTSGFHDARHDACVATEIRHDQSPELLDKRMQCLDRAASETRVLLAVLSDHPDGPTIDHSIESVLGLRALSECADREALLAAAPPPPAALRPRVDAADLELQRVEAQLRLGNYPAAQKLALALVQEVEGIPYIPLRARVHFAAAQTELRLDRNDAAVAGLRESGELGAAAHDDVLVARCWIFLYQTLGSRLARIAEAQQIEPLAAAAVMRANHSLELRGLLDAARATSSLRAGEYAKSAAEYEVGTRELEQALGPKHLTLAAVLGNRGTALESAGRYDDARKVMDRSLAIRGEALGEEHIAVADIRYELGALLDTTGRPEEALEQFQRSLAIQLKVLPPDHSKNATVYISLGVVLTELGRADEALAYQLHAIEILDHDPAQHRGRMGPALMDLGNTYRKLSRLGEALAAYDRALAIETEVYGPDNAHVADVLENKGYALSLHHDDARAVEAWERGLAIREKTLGPDHPELAKALGNLAENDYDHHRYASALARLDRAIAILEKSAAGQLPLEFMMHEMRGDVYVALHRVPDAVADFAIARAAYVKLGMEAETKRVDEQLAKTKRR
ncbi:MAG: serine/threonine-protein kinase [Kofleriaceae bacterium]